MKDLLSKEKYDGQIEDGVFISPFPVPKYQLLKTKWQVSPKGKTVICRYSGDGFKIAYVHCKNAEAVHICYGHDREFLNSKFTLKGHSTLVSDTLKSNQRTENFQLLKGKYCSETVLEQKEFESIFLALSPDWLDRYQKELENTGRFCGSLHKTLLNKLAKPIRYSSRVGDLVGNLKKIMSPYFFDETYLVLKIKEVLFLLHSEIRESFTIANGIHGDIRLLETFVDYIEENFFFNSNISTVYEELGCSATAMNRIVKSHIGITPKELLTQTRMDYAKEQLESGAMNVSELGHALHYSTQNHFSRAFRNWFGYSPSQIKKES
ncbi:DNA-binding domain-containing protein, AraC-type [Belliella baltica DSM 15883]|uniref:DNA-binding domain-containing protein, AraC-type n=1 Tax=Belliella baltica (strain DSM 15883 / CIP 108006 / LMG 21964 / BA134) TaxID=866536 RepID=I3Z934_BELBD|nr:AraC family transcriptional regulator [Belliella baltica]AFL85752.1 DNA-binding domain-containing protein, AraC-type [Belliella baltica DSM 15883]